MASTKASSSWTALPVELQRHILQLTVLTPGTFRVQPYSFDTGDLGRTALAPAFINRSSARILLPVLEQDVLPRIEEDHLRYEAAFTSALCIAKTRGETRSDPALAMFQCAKNDARQETKTLQRAIRIISKWEASWLAEEQEQYDPFTSPPTIPCDFWGTVNETLSRQIWKDYFNRPQPVRYTPPEDEDEDEADPTYPRLSRTLSCMSW